MDTKLVQSLPNIKNEKLPSGKKKVFKRGFSQVTPLICAFCGGRSCKHENWLTHPTSAIKGLNSDWITHNILATQRPSSRIIAEYNIIEQFKAKEIGAILNLQEPGEHPHCGDGINPQSGFSYCPEEFYEHGIYFFNFGWRDMTATSTDVILKVLKQMSFILLNGEKIAIHCHAGRGRTGMIIAAWLIYHEGMTAKDAIKLVKTKRKDSISKKSQEDILYKLEKEIRALRTVFFLSHKIGLDQYIYNQKQVIPLSSVSEEKFVPKVILVILERMESLLVSNTCDAKQIMCSFFSVNDASFIEKWDAKHEKNIKFYKEKINFGDFQLSEIDDPRYLAQMLLDFLDSFGFPAIGRRFIDAIQAKFGHNSKLTEDEREKFSKEVDKKEFFLFESLARFFSTVIEADRTVASMLPQAINRVCISLLLERHKLDKLFVKRSLIKLPENQDRIDILRGFTYKWIESFNEEIENFLPVCNLSPTSSPKKAGKKTIVQIARTKTLLNKTIEKRRASESALNLTGLNSQNLFASLFSQESESPPKKKTTKVVAENTKANSSTDSGSKSSESGSYQNTPYRKGFSPSIKTIQEDLDDSFNEEDTFPSSTRTQNYGGNSHQIKPLDLGSATERENKSNTLVDLVIRSKQNSERNYPKSVVIDDNYDGRLPTLAMKVKKTKPTSVSLASPKMNDLVSTFEQLDGVDQEILLHKLYKLHADKQKAVVQ